ncbi:MAG: L-2-amino-thiazoline-4-carboxylic acid hydrolase [Lachnospiraceae bacterium]|nr:L-2-amino-thiazoline-4-carboxylic acid hydrolase [Lachnospiraceae bacterium]
MDKHVKTYSKLYKAELKERKLSDIETRVNLYEQRLTKMYASDIFLKHNIYPTTDTVKIYAVIAMCLELKNDNYSDKEIIDFVNGAFKNKRKFFAAIIKVINILPNSYQIAKKWNISDHNKRVKDGSVTYDYFNVTEEKVEYSISKCMYVEMFEYYGIRGLCKIFCMTDEFAYANLPKHVKYIRYSDLSDGDVCHDEVINKRTLIH